MKVDFKRELRRSKQRIEHRLRDRVWSPQDKPMLSARNIHYELSSRDRAITAGGIGAMQQLAQKLGWAAAIDDKLQLLKVHLPYSESDHVLNLAYNTLAGGTWTRLARSASPTRRRPATSAGASRRSTSMRCRTCSTRLG